jgi:hypothetical protein
VVRQGGGRLRVDLDGDGREGHGGLNGLIDCDAATESPVCIRPSSEWISDKPRGKNGIMYSRFEWTI